MKYFFCIVVLGILGFIIFRNIKAIIGDIRRKKQSKKEVKKE